MKRMRYVRGRGIEFKATTLVLIRLCHRDFPLTLFTAPTQS